MNISPQGQQPSAISVNMAPDAPEDAAAAAQNLADMQELWTAWHCFTQRKLKGEQVLAQPPKPPEAFDCSNEIVRPCQSLCLGASGLCQGTDSTDCAALAAAERHHMPPSLLPCMGYRCTRLCELAMTGGILFWGVFAGCGRTEAPLKQNCEYCQRSFAGKPKQAPGSGAPAGGYRCSNWQLSDLDTDVFALFTCMHSQHFPWQILLVSAAEELKQFVMLILFSNQVLSGKELHPSPSIFD